MTKILLVEDNEMNKDMLSRRLIKKGYDIIFAMDGQEAIDMAKSEMPDIILRSGRTWKAASNPFSYFSKNGVSCGRVIKHQGLESKIWTRNPSKNKKN